MLTMVRGLVFLMLNTRFMITDSVDFNNSCENNDLRPTIQSIMALGTKIELDCTGTIVLSAAVPHKVRLFGRNLHNSTISFTTSEKVKGDTCNLVKRSRVFPLQVIKEIGSLTVAQSEVYLDTFDPGEKYYYLCLLGPSPLIIWEHQGKDPWLRVSVNGQSVLPMWLVVLLIIVLLTLSGIFSGLGLGLMSLDITELHIIMKGGNTTERQQAAAIFPLRQKGNFLLCSLLIGNVLVNNGATVLLDNTFGESVIAIVVSTIGIVVLGEIVPQAICSRHGLFVGAKTVWLTKIFMLLTSPLSYPIGRLLDIILGEEMGQAYNKTKLQELIRMTADNKILQTDEANIISGALQLSQKKVEDVMTKLEDVFMLEIDVTLDFLLMSEILRSGFTRVPVYDGEKNNIVGLLNTKDLALIDPDDGTALKTVCQFYDHRPLYVDHSMSLNQMLREFLTAGNSHMAVVQKLHNEDDCDPYYEVLGVVTLEDVIEEILQSEIIDETDVITDNRRKKVRQREKRDYSVFNQAEAENVLPPQLALAALQYLSTSVDPFRDDFVSRTVLKKLIRQNIVVNLTPTEPPSERNIIYQEGKECDYFIIILEGHADVAVGKDKMVFEAGPFCCFGTQVLMKVNELLAGTSSRTDSSSLKFEPYIPDFTLTATSQIQFLKIRRAHYLAARRATVLTRSQQESHTEEEMFNKEWKKALLSRNNSAAGISDLVRMNFSDIIRSRNNSAATMSDVPANDYGSPTEKADSLLKRTLVTEAQLALDHSRSKSLLESPASESIMNSSPDLLSPREVLPVISKEHSNSDHLDSVTVDLVARKHADCEINVDEGNEEHVCLVDSKGQKDSSKVHLSSL